MSDELYIDESDVIDELPQVNGWSPPAGVTNHSRTLTIDADRDFFAPPPEEIGDVVSAASSLSVNTRPWRTATRIVVAGLTAWVTSLVIGFFVPDVTFFQILGFLIVFPIVWLILGFSHTCSYVGSRGVARFKCGGNRDRIKKTEIFLFEDATELRTSQTRNYHNGIYSGTIYSHTWTDEEGRKRFRLNGSYYAEKKLPKPKDAFHFALSAETAWSLFLLENVNAELEQRGAVRFRLGGDDYVDLGPGFVEVRLKNKIERLSAAELGGVSLESGVVKIKRVDAKEGWFSSTGVYQFNFDRMANFRLFGILYGHMIPE